MYAALVRWTIRRNIRALGAGDAAPLLRGYADDATLVFPGTSSWAGTHRGKAAIEAFIRRFVSVGLKGEAEEILVAGPPWRTLIAVLFNDRATSPDGQVVYRNRAVLFARMRWGKIVYQEDFEDTHKVEAFDRWLRQEASSPVSGSTAAT
jgi:ketosteroid isomerase-like protein